jgi:hypothetical protein
LNFHLPLINKIREAERHLSLFIIAAVLLTGVGFDELRRSLQSIIERRQAWLPASIFPGLLIVSLCAAIGVQIVAWRHPHPYQYVVLIFPPLTAPFGLLARWRPWSYALAALLISLSAMICPPRTFNLAISSFMKPENLESHKILQELKTRLQPGNYRVDFVDPVFNPADWAMNASYYGFDSFYNTLTPQPYEQFRIGWSLRRPFLRELMGNRYVLCAPNSKPLDPLAKFRFQIGGYGLFENPTYMDRVALAHSLAGVYTDQADLLRKIGRGFDFKHSVYLEEQDAVKLRLALPHDSRATARLADETIVIEHEATNHIAIRIATELPAVVVLNQWFTPAWKATVNGKSSAIFRANRWQVGVPVRAGNSIVEFWYRPSVSRALLIVNLVSWVVIALLGIGLVGSRIMIASKALRIM